MCIDSEDKSKGLKWIYILRQSMISCGTMMYFFAMGLNSGAPTVLVPQLRQESNSTDAVTPEQASWLPALLALCGLPWIFLLSTLAALYGRKLTHTIVSISSFTGFIIFYCSSDIRQIMVSQIFQGAVSGGHLTAAVIVDTEYTSKEYRGLFLILKPATFFWGVLVANSIGTFFHWKNIPLLGIVCLMYNLVTVWFWPESPLWLADKGHFEQCSKSYRWLMGSSANSEKELENLIALKSNVKKYISIKCKLLNIIKLTTKKQFYKPLLLVFLIQSLKTFSGKIVYTVYAVEILKKITNDTSAAYTGMLIIDAVTVFSIYIGCTAYKIVKRRTMLLTTSAISILLMFLLSLYLYLVKLSFLSQDTYISVLLLVGFSITTGCGILSLAVPICGELLPIESRSVSACGMGLIQTIYKGILLKIAPYMFSSMGTYGTFFLFGVFSVICLILIYFYVPETQGKSLQEIADYFKNVTPVEESKELLPIAARNVNIVPRN